MRKYVLNGLHAMHAAASTSILCQNDSHFFSIHSSPSASRSTGERVDAIAAYRRNSKIEANAIVSNRFYAAENTVRDRFISMGVRKVHQRVSVHCPEAANTDAHFSVFRLESN